MAGLELDDRYPGLLGIGYSVKLAPESLAAQAAAVLSLAVLGVGLLQKSERRTLQEIA